MNFKNWPPLHQAVIQDDIDAIKRLKELPGSRKSLDPRGREAIELAQFLARKTAALLLQERELKRIKVQIRNEEMRKVFSSELEPLLGFNYTPCLKFSSLEQLETVCNNRPWLIAHTFYGQNAKALGKKFDLEISAGYVCDCVIKWRSDEIGYGLYAGVDLLPGVYIGEYTGEVRHVNRLKPELNGYCFHYPTRFFSWRYTVIDSQKWGNETRFINHSDKPNLELAWALKNDLMHLIFIANRFIEKGEELTIDYGPDYWRYRKQEPE